MRISRKRQLGVSVSSADTRPLDRQPTAAKRHLPSLATVAHKSPPRIPLALRADNIVDLVFHQLGQDTQPKTHAERQKPLPRGPDEFAECLLHTGWQHNLLGGRLRDRYGLPHGGSSFDLWMDHLERSQPERTRPEGPPPTKFHELRDNLRFFWALDLPTQAGPDGRKQWMED